MMALGGAVLVQCLLPVVQGAHVWPLLWAVVCSYLEQSAHLGPPLIEALRVRQGVHKIQALDETRSPSRGGERSPRDVHSALSRIHEMPSLNVVEI